MMLSKQKTPLPEGYTRLNYVQNTGGSYIDTGYVCSSDNAPKKIRAVFQRTSPSSSGDLFGVIGSGTTFNNPLIFGLEWYSADNKWWWVFLHDGAGKLNSIYAKFGTPDYEKTELVFASKDGVYINGVKASECDQHVAISSNSGQSLMIFGRNNGGTSVTRTNIKVKLFEFEIHGENGLERNFIPAKRDSDDVVGLFDTVTREFYTTGGTTALVGG